MVSKIVKSIFNFLFLVYGLFGVLKFYGVAGLRPDSIISTGSILSTYIVLYFCMYYKILDRKED